MTAQRVIAASAAQVWDVLADGWLYPVFVVGAARMRDVDAHWPAAGARLHHSAGMWPLMLDDITTSERCEPRRLLVLAARGWPAGTARVTLRLEPAGRKQTRVSIEEDATAGVALAVPGVARRLLLDLRNAETLQRLELLALGRAGR